MCNSSTKRIGIEIHFCVEAAAGAFQLGTVAPHCPSPAASVSPGNPRSRRRGSGTSAPECPCTLSSSCGIPERRSCSLSCAGSSSEISLPLSLGEVGWELDNLPIKGFSSLLLLIAEYP